MGEPVPDNSITVPPEAPPQPKIDWEREAELAAQSGVASICAIRTIKGANR
jgi:hypothetical protein